ncbi:LysE/ArgO family amino acid transporter [Paenibacillus sp. N3/727]|uniref:LysE/ArgO family amino acid transporter n=1 Tax=Paenibacillus sp. N3/727 TaxID=2925845 RepID=UPI001F53DDB0|nr:LysE/ArgO family amino acid transporter [Paenibacillus sp. N3/727]UNK18137.1 LysE/ArgO family amino acid transporter [Paenibacillus sp. N3/727]
MIEAILHAVLLAFGLILPLGVQNVFIFNQGAVNSRFIRALPAVLTASVCDTLLIFAAVGGVSLVILKFAWLETTIYAVGVLFLLYMGFSIWRSKGGGGGQSAPLSARKQVLYAASVSLLNPHAILDTVGVIGTSSLAYEGMTKWIFALTAAIVSWLWFLALALAGRMLGRVDTTGRSIAVLNTVSALIIWLLALYMALQLFGILT